MPDEAYKIEGIYLLNGEEIKGKYRLAQSKAGLQLAIKATRERGNKWYPLVRVEVTVYEKRSTYIV